MCSVLCNCKIQQHKQYLCSMENMLKTSVAVRSSSLFVLFYRLIQSTVQGGVVASGRVCACSLRSRLVYPVAVLLPVVLHMLL